MQFNFNGSRNSNTSSWTSKFYGFFINKSFFKGRHCRKKCNYYFNFGQSFGVLKGICAALKLPIYFVRPVKWKKYFNLIKTNKDASRTKVIEIFPYISSKIPRKKDSNKADSILIAKYFEETQNV